MPLTPHEPKRTYQFIADKLRTMIQSGEYALGARLPPERDLGRQLQVSRNVVREAILALEVAGYVETRHGVGTVVVAAEPRTAARAEVLAGASPSDILSVRRAIEPQVAAVAAASATPEDIARLEDAVKGIMQDDAFPPTEAADWSRTFQMRLAEATHNPAWVVVTDELWRLMRSPLMEGIRVRSKIYLNRRRRQRFRRDVIECIGRRDAVGAREAMERHIDAVYAFLFDKPVR
ncbi:MAG: FadR/GntR family transcriptional regulator [Burkholderiales bacterium]